MGSPPSRGSLSGTVRYPAGVTIDGPHAQPPRHVGRAEWTLTRGSPLARGVTFQLFAPLSAVLMALLWFVAGFVGFRVFGVVLSPFPWALIGILAAWPLAIVWMRHTARSQSVAVEVFDDRVRFASRRGELVFPVATTQAEVGVWEWASGGRYGPPHQIWTVLLLRSGASVFSLGTRGSRVSPSVRGRMPMHSCDRHTLAAVAALWQVRVP
jgi:hypothetical protein